MRLEVIAALVALAPSTTSAASVPCRVVGITDGDTLTCLVDGKVRLKVRLAQIDAPEKTQPFGQKSKQALSALVFGKDVVLDAHSKDRYGRTIATVFLRGADVNLEMVKSGMAWVYDQYAHDPGYFVAQHRAAEGRRGLWADSRGIKPSEWRAMKR